MTLDEATVIVMVQPDAVPADIGNTVRGVRSDIDVAMSWASAVYARTYNLYQGTTKGSWPPALRTDLVSVTHSLTDVPQPPSLYFYRVTGASCSGMEGP